MTQYLKKYKANFKLRYLTIKLVTILYTLITPDEYWKEMIFRTNLLSE